MKIGKDSPIRMYHKGSAYYDSGCLYEWQPGNKPEYTGWADEQMSWKTDCYLGDWTNSLNEMWVSGSDAIEFFKAFNSNSFEKFGVGKAKHYMMCNEKGQIVAEGVLMRLSEEQFVFQSNVFYAYYQYCTNRERFPNLTVEVPEPYPYCGSMKLEAKLFKFQLQGPKALAHTEKVTGQDLKDVKFMNFVPVKILGYDCIALRQGMSGEIGFEIQGPIEHAQEIYDYIFREGEEFGCRRLGTRTSMINHLEACYPTGAMHFAPAVDEGYEQWQRDAGMEPFYPAMSGSYDGEYEYLTCNPYELNWAMCVKFDHEFQGRKALEDVVDSVKRKVVTLELNSEDMIEIYASLFDTENEPYEVMELPMTPNFAMQADKILDMDGNLIGFATDPGYSIYFRKILSLSVIEKPFDKPGTEVQVLWGAPGKRQKLIRATVAPAPYKTDNRKVDLKKV